MIASIHDYALYMLDPNGYVVSWNPGAERIKGYREEEILGQSFSPLRSSLRMLLMQEKNITILGRRSGTALSHFEVH